VSHLNLDIFCQEKKKKLDFVFLHSVSETGESVEQGQISVKQLGSRWELPADGLGSLAGRWLRNVQVKYFNPARVNGGSK